MSRGRLVFLGGNGHCAARLDPARRAITAGRASFDILDVPYPGFEGRASAAGYEAFLDITSERIAEAADGPGARLYATGIGGLVALGLRARGSHVGLPLLLQAPVLWGLERRWMPRLLRLLPARGWLHRVFASPRFRRRFARTRFVQAVEPAVIDGFFEGYARCAALPDLFAWMDAALLRRLEESLRGRPERLAGITAWWGGRDRVVSLRELRWAERALGVSWPARVFPDWGHYPMIDTPREWVAALDAELAATA